MLPAGHRSAVRRAFELAIHVAVFEHQVWDSEVRSRGGQKTTEEDSGPSADAAVRGSRPVTDTMVRRPDTELLHISSCKATETGERIPRPDLSVGVKAARRATSARKLWNPMTEVRGV